MADVCSPNTIVRSYRTALLERLNFAPGCVDVGLVLLVLGVVVSGVACGAAQPAPPDINGGKYGPVFSSFFGGAGEDTIRDVVFDSVGNLYITGGTSSADLPTTRGAYSRTFSTGGTSTGSSGFMDVFVAKFSPGGQLIWSTYLGGPNYDRAYGIELDSKGNVIVAGRAGEGFPTTAGTVQPAFGGHLDPLGAYGKQDGFVAKLSADGSRLLWSTYFGGPDISFIRSFALDHSENIYIALAAVTRPNPHITSGSAQTTLAGGSDGVVAKLTANGQQVVWASYLGGSGNDSEAPSIKVNQAGEAYVLIMTQSRDIPTTAKAFDREFNGGWDFYVARYNATGDQLIYGTYLGGGGEESLETHSLAIDGSGNAFVTGYTSSTNYPTTPGAFQKENRGGEYDVPISKLSADGSTLLASTFVGGEGTDGAQGLQILDDSETVVVSGTTSSRAFPKTAQPIQSSLAGRDDFFVVKLDENLSRLFYASFFGGSSDDSGRALRVHPAGLICVAGMTSSDNFPLVSAFQSKRREGLDGALLVFRIADP